MNTTRIVVSLLVAVLGLSACATDEFGNSRKMTDAEKGALIGALGGAVVGGAVTKKKDRKKGVVIGAIGGGLAGAAVGNYMDNQKRDLEKVLMPERNAGAIEIERLPENALRVTMTDQTAFAVNSADIQPGFTSTMDKIASVVNRYGKTTLTVAGHTDSTGSAEYNQGLSERRAKTVENYFLGKGVVPQRLDSYGFGETSPRSSNSTEAGRKLNRRVEIDIEPVVADQS